LQTKLAIIKLQPEMISNIGRLWKNWIVIPTRYTVAMNLIRIFVAWLEKFFNRLQSLLLLNQ
jgi:uncharacterized protein YjiS (DUF1127 family)